MIGASAKCATPKNGLSVQSPPAAAAQNFTKSQPITPRIAGVKTFAAKQERRQKIKRFYCDLKWNGGSSLGEMGQKVTTLRRSELPMRGTLFLLHSNLGLGSKFSSE